MQFYNGVIPLPFATLDSSSVRHPHREYCDFLAAEVEARINELSFQGGQVIMGKHGSSKLDELIHLHASNCYFQNLAEEFSFDLMDVTDFRPALLQFMVAATPKDDIVNDILGNFDSYVNRMVVTPTSHFAPSGSSVEFVVDQVPDTVNPVKAKMAYVQVPNAEGDMHLNLVWRVRLGTSDLVAPVY